MRIMILFALVIFSSLLVAENITITLDENRLELRKEGLRIYRIDLVSFSGLKVKVNETKTFLLCTKTDETDFYLYSVLETKVSAKDLVLVPMLEGESLKWAVLTKQGLVPKEVEDIRVFLHSLMFYEYQRVAIEAATLGEGTTLGKDMTLGAAYKGFPHFQLEGGSNAQALFFIGSDKPYALLGPFWGPDAVVEHCFEKSGDQRSLLISKPDKQKKIIKYLVTLDYKTQAYTEKVLGEK